MIRLSLGSNLNPDDIEEGNYTDFYILFFGKNSRRVRGMCQIKYMLYKYNSLTDFLIDILFYTCLFP